MTSFIDTSAFLALLDADDQRHAEAVERWHELAEQEAALVTTNYVVVETIAVAQHRLGIDAVRTLVGDVLPLVHLVFVTDDSHAAALSTLLAAGRRRLSLVDCVSFQVMRDLSITTAFAYDPHFAEQGFSGK